MTHPRKPPSSKRASLEAAFSEPVYERLRFSEGGNEMQLLAFVRLISPELRTYLTNIGAKPSQHLEANCYSETWELSPDWLATPPVTLAELDLCIASGLNILGGKFPHSAGYWSHPITSGSDDKPHSTSALLRASERQQKGQTRR